MVHFVPLLPAVNLLHEEGGGQAASLFFVVLPFSFSLLVSPAASRHPSSLIGSYLRHSFGHAKINLLFPKGEAI